MKNEIETKSESSRTKTASEASSKAASGVRAMPAAKELRELFQNELMDIYWAEAALVKALPQIIKNATSPELIEALKEHLSDTMNQVKRAEAVFTSINIKPRTKICQAMLGLIKEAEEIVQNTTKGMVRDAGIISSVQKMEHYEIASYGTLCAFARTLGEVHAASLLHETLGEEKQADGILTEIAESFVNSEAV